MQKAQAGVSLLELMLVLAIGSVLLIVGMQQYYQWSNYSYEQQLTFNIDSLFQAMADYYKSNCADSYDQTGAVVANTGALSPTSLASTNPYPPANSQPIAISTLQSNGFLPQWQPSNPLVAVVKVDPKNPTAGSYVAQFNPTVMDRSIRACWNFSSTPGNEVCNSSPTIPTGSHMVVTWRIQVAVKIQDTANINTYKNQLLADCTSSPTGSGSDITIAPCSSNQPGNYLVWERTPSFVSSNIKFKSTQWQTDSQLREFRLQYTNDPMYEYTNETYANTEYYLCGG